MNRRDDSERPQTPETLIGGYLLASVMLGAEFVGVPFPGYVKSTVATLIDDLRLHGYEITQTEPEAAA